MPKITPLIKADDKWLFVDKVDWAVFLFIWVPANTITQQSSFAWISWALIPLFIIIEYIKTSMEKKEQNLFRVLFQNSKYPKYLIGRLNVKQIIGVNVEKSDRT